MAAVKGKPRIKKSTIISRSQKSSFLLLTLYHIPMKSKWIFIAAIAFLISCDKQGPAGPAGSNGSNGLNGATGASGPTGPTGPTGATGTSGTNGTTNIKTNIYA